MGETILLDTAPLRDQRTMVAVSAPRFMHQTVEDVEQAWKQWAETEGFTIRRRRGDFARDLRQSRKIVVAYVSGGKWVGDCPSCNGGIATWPFHDRGCCLDCGTIYPITFPAKEEIEQAVRLLAGREENQRHWHVHRGETLEQLEAENTLLRRQSILKGAVDVNAIRDVLGHDAIEKLQKAGVV